jgi:glycopeptide antibiotics resistance protein
MYMLVIIILIVPVNYTVNKKKYRHTECIIIIYTLQYCKLIIVTLPIKLLESLSLC